MLETFVIFNNMAFLHISTLSVFIFVFLGNARLCKCHESNVMDNNFFCFCSSILYIFPNCFLLFCYNDFWFVFSLQVSIFYCLDPSALGIDILTIAKRAKSKNRISNY